MIQGLRAAPTMMRTHYKPLPAAWPLGRSVMAMRQSRRPESAAGIDLMASAMEVACRIAIGALARTA